nr:hypothetical protein [Tanacetum cinerariifolium]
MDDLSITMEEYIRLQEEKAQRHGRTFNWQTATYGKMEYYEDEDDSFTNFETEYPAIVFDDTSDATLSCEPMPKMDIDDDDINVTQSSGRNAINIGTEGLNRLQKTSHDKIRKIFNVRSFIIELIINIVTSNYLNNGIPLSLLKNLYVSFGITFDPKRYYKDGIHTKKLRRSRDQRHPWLKYQAEGYNEDIVHSYELRLKTTWGRSVSRVHVLDFVGLTEKMRHTLGDQLRMVYTGDEGQELFTSHAWRRLFEIRAPLVREFILEFLSTCRMSGTEMGLVVTDTLCFQLGGARRSERVIPDKGDLRDYWIEISSEKDFLGPVPSYVYIRDPLRRLCHMMIACSVSGRGQAPKKYLFRHVDGRKSGARLFEGHFIGCLATHFGLVSDQGLRGLSVAWIASGPEKQQVVAAGAPEATEDVPVADEGALAVPAPVQAPQPPPPAARTARTTGQRLARVKKEVRELRQSIVGLRGDIRRFITEQSRFAIWMISCMTQLMDASGLTDQAYDITLIGTIRRILGFGIWRIDPFTICLRMMSSLSLKNDMLLRDNGCSYHMTGDRTLLKNFIEKFIGIVRFGNDHFAEITGYGDYVQESMNASSKKDLDNLFGPMCEEYFEKKSSEMPINSAAQQTQNHEGSPLTSSINIEEHEAPPIVTTSEEQTSPIFLNESDEFHQEDSAELDGNTLLTPYDAPDFFEAESSTYLDPSNMHEFHQKHGMNERVSMSTPMTTERLDADIQGTPTDQTTYHRMIGGLMYLTASRPDIAFATFVCARYQARPMVRHLKETMQDVKTIVKALHEAYNF